MGKGAQTKQKLLVKLQKPLRLVTKDVVALKKIERDTQDNISKEINRKLQYEVHR